MIKTDTIDMVEQYRFGLPKHLHHLLSKDPIHWTAEEKIMYDEWRLYQSSVIPTHEQVLTKQQCADWLGISYKSMDRVNKTDALAHCTLKINGIYLYNQAAMMNPWVLLQINSQLK